MDRETEAMIKTMEKRNIYLRKRISVDFDMGQPIQELFDNCLNFISVNDFEI